MKELEDRTIETINGYELLDASEMKMIRCELVDGELIIENQYDVIVNGETCKEILRMAFDSDEIARIKEILLTGST